MYVNLQELCLSEETAARERSDANACGFKLVLSTILVIFFSFCNSNHSHTREPIDALHCIIQMLLRTQNFFYV